MLYVHAMEYYAAIKMTEALIHVATQMNLENIKLSEKGQTPKVTCCMIPCMWNIQNRQTLETKIRLMIARDWVREEWGVIA